MCSAGLGGNNTQTNVSTSKLCTDFCALYSYPQPGLGYNERLTPLPMDVKWMAEAWKQLRGQVVEDRFPLLQCLCGSDQCAVFLTSLNQQKAAIKLIPTVPGTPNEQFKAWQAASKLSHPHLLKLVRAGQWTKNGQSFLYVVTEFADEDLSQILPQRALTARETRDMLRPLLAVLAHLHQNNFVHGHLKPSNILATGDQLKVSSDGLHAVGDLINGSGTPSIYLAPEVDNQGLSPASDVWALGVVLVEVLTQRPPVWEDKRSDPKIPASVPDPFREIAENCLHRDPAQRWTVDRIQACLGATPSSTPMRSEAIKNEAPVKRRFTLPLIAAIVIVAVFLAARFAGRPSQKSSQTATTQSVPVSQASEASPVAAEPVSAPVAEAPRTTTAPASGSVLKQVVPDVPRSARNTIQGTVKVSVVASVDPSGDVTATHFETHGPSAYFANLAMKAAKDWKFKAPQVDGREMSSTWTLHFDFKRSGTNVHSSQKSIK